MEIKRGYKQTEIGVIPEDWEVERLGNIGHWFSGGTPSMANDQYWNGQIPWVSAKDMKVARIRDSILHVTAKAIGNGTRLAPPETLLMVVRGMILAHTFPVAVATRPIAFNQDIKALTVRVGIDSEFILRWLQANAQRVLEIASESTHGTKRIPSSDLFSMKIALPPLPAQHSIAGALSDADALIESLERLIEKKRKFKQGAMQELLTGKTRLPGFEVQPEYKQTEIGMIPVDWDVKPLRALADKIMVGIASAATHAYRDRGIVMFRNQNIKPGRLDDSDILYIDPNYEAIFKNKRLKSGDLLTARTGYPGTTSIVPQKYEGAQSFTTLITRPSCHLIDPNYLCCFINSNAGQAYFEQNQIGGGQKNVNAGSLKHLPVPVPPTKAEQEAIAATHSDMDAEIIALEAKLAKSRQIKRGMLQELLTGRIRLE